MQDEPTPQEILESVIAFLRDVVASKLPPREAFDARVAANALELVRRQMAFDVTAAERDEATRQRLVQLLGQEGSLDELNRVLCSRIASGELGLSNQTLMDYLWTTTFAKVAVDQPTYASYQRSLAERGGPR
jgi:Domain of unknown function (DUF6285)